MTKTEDDLIEFLSIIDPKIIKAMNPPYPRWEQWEIKRAYGDRPAIYIDKWVPTRPSLLKMLPLRRYGLQIKYPKSICKIGMI